MDNGAGSYRRFLAGDESAFDEIIEQFSDSLIFFIHRYVQDIAAAEDIAIDVFADLIAYPHRYNFSVQLKTYLFMLGRSRALNYIKRRNKLTVVELSDATVTELDEHSLEEIVLKRERERSVNAALKKLPEEMRLAVHLFYFEELSYEEVARVMKKNRKQVDNLLYRAKNTLRTILGKEGELLL